MEYSSEKREKTSISVRPSIWERFDQERLRRGYSTAANALEVALSEWLSEPKHVDMSDREAHGQLDDLLASPEADAVRDMLAWMHAVSLLWVHLLETAEKDSMRRSQHYELLLGFLYAKNEKYTPDQLRKAG